MAAPTTRLTSGFDMPIHGLGTWRSDVGQVKAAVKHALKCGYTHIDAAYVYQNQKEVASAIKEELAAGTIKRKDLFVTSKLWNTQHKKEDVMPALKKCLEELGLDYLDLYLIHWPVAFEAGDAYFPQRVEGDMSTVKVVDVPHKETWEALEACVDAGLTRSIGVSNFTARQIKELLPFCRIRPAVNQVELHPYNSQKDLVKYCQDNNIVVTAYSPLGTPDWRKPDQPLLLEDKAVTAIAKKHNKTNGQVLIKWSLQNGLICIPKSVTPARIEENRMVFDFNLSSEDMKAIDALNSNTRFVLPVWRQTWD